MSPNNRILLKGALIPNLPTNEKFSKFSNFFGNVFK